jgi:transposase InsO family protein
MKKMDDVFNEIYFDPSHPASFGSAYSLYKAAKARDKTVKLKDVKEWLSGQQSHILHRKVNAKFQRRKTIAKDVGHFWQSDLAVFEGIARYNKGYKYILVNIDVFSRKAFATPLKRKNAQSMVNAFRKLFKDQKPPINLQSDLGKEYWNAPLQKLFREHKVNFFSVHSDQKASIAERFIRSLKDRMFRYFTHKNTLNYVSVLPALLKAYNNKGHRSLGGIAPNQVNKFNRKNIWEFQYGGFDRSKSKKSKFKVGDKVVITKLRRTFKKGYLPKWTREKFVIVDRIRTVPPVWKLADEKGEVIRGIFYDAELQKVS